tara:strand:+ start:224 stop:1471 length:1248 start_codon:yes stop_codon:yes gene_type:complete
MGNKNIFIKDFTKFFSGVFLSQIISFSISPILSRIYTPSDFGSFTLYMQILMPLTVIGSLSLNLLMPRFKLPELKVLTFQVVMLISAAVGLLVLFTYPFLTSFSLNSTLQLWPLLAFGVVLSNLRGFFHFATVGDKRFLLNSKAKTFEGFVGAGMNVLGGFLGFGTLGLVIGNFSGQIVYISTMVRRYKLKSSGYFKFKSIKSYSYFLNSHRKHVVIQSFNHLLEYFLILSFSIIITRFTSLKGLGYFAFYLKVVNTPLTIIADYFSQAVLNRASDFRQNSDIKSFLIKGTFLTAIPGIVAIVILRTFGPELFKFIFGSEWEFSGIIAESFILGSVASFFIRSFQYIPNLKNKHEVYTVFAFLTYGVPVGYLMFANSFGLDFIEALKTLAIILMGLALSYFLVLYFWLLKDKVNQ